MTFNIKVKNKDLEIKFNYGLLFKVNKMLGSKDQDGNSQNDGAGVLFTKVLDGDDTALVDVIRLVSKTATEEDVVAAIENYVEVTELDEEEAYNQVFEDFKAEMLESGFFVSKVKKYIKNLEKAVEVLKKKEDDQSKMQAEAIEELLVKMNKEIS